jgi:hypothetical protein
MVRYGGNLGSRTWSHGGLNLAMHISNEDGLFYCRLYMSLQSSGHTDDLAERVMPVQG